MKLIRDVINDIDARPGMTNWDYAVHLYAVELLEKYVSDRQLIIWDDVSQITKMTEKDLLDYAKDWIQYSFDGNALIWTEDVCMRLFGRKAYVLNPIRLFKLQAVALKCASRFIIQTLMPYNGNVAVQT